MTYRDMTDGQLAQQCGYMRQGLVMTAKHAGQLAGAHMMQAEALLHEVQRRLESYEAQGDDLK